MTDADLIIQDARELVTLAGAGEAPLRGEALRDIKIVRGGSVAVRGGAIVAVGCAEKIRDEVSLIDGGTVIDAAGKMVIPGLVDPHTHLIFADHREEEFLMRAAGKTYMEISAEGGGILSTMAGTRAASKERLVAKGLARLDEMMSWGTTTVEIKSGYGLDPKSEIKMLEAVAEISGRHRLTVVATFLGAHSYPPEFSRDHDGYIAQIVDQMLPEIARRKLAEFCDVFCETGVFSLEDSRAVLAPAQAAGLAPKVHADELSAFGATGLAAELGARSVEHLNFATDDDLDQLSRSDTVAVLLPATPFFLLAPRYADARKIIARNVPVALATDYNPTCSISSMLFVIFLACLKMKMDPAEALAAATINAAHAINRNHTAGSLEVGKMGDFVVLDVPSHRDIPFYVGRNIVHAVVKNGRVVAGGSYDKIVPAYGDGEGEKTI